MWNCLKLILSLSSFPSPLLSSFLSLFSPSSSSDTVAFREASWHLLTVIMILDLGPPHLQLMILVSSLLVFDLSVKSHNMTASGELQGHLILHLIMCKKKKKKWMFYTCTSNVHEHIQSFHTTSVISCTCICKWFILQILS